MTEWTNDELTRIGSADELELSSFRRDGTLRRPVTIWVAPVEDNLYVRSVNGPNAAWYRGTQVTHEGRIRAGGVEKDVRFVDADHGIDGEVDAAYRAKYRRYGERFVNPIVSPDARSTTIKLVPRSTGP